MVPEDVRGLSLQKAVLFSRLYKMMCSTRSFIEPTSQKSMRSRGGRPCCGGSPCRPPKMHQIGNEVVRDWSLRGSLHFCIFFVKISAGKKSEASLGCSCMNDAFGCFWMPLDACSASKYIYMYTYVHIRMDENGFPYLKCIYINTSRYFLKIYQLYIHLYSSMSQETEATSARGAIWTSAGFSSEAGC